MALARTANFLRLAARQGVAYFDVRAASMATSAASGFNQGHIKVEESIRRDYPEEWLEGQSGVKSGDAAQGSYEGAKTGDQLKDLKQASKPGQQVKEGFAKAQKYASHAKEKAAEFTDTMKSGYETTHYANQDSALDSATDKAKRAWYEAKDAAGDALSGDTNAASRKFEDAKSDAKDAWQDVKASATNVKENLRDTAFGAKSKAKDTWEDVKDTAKDVAGARGADTWSEAKYAAKDVARSAADKLGDAKYAAKDAWSEAKYAAKDVARDVKQKASQAWSETKEAAKTAKDELGSDAKLAKNAYEDAKAGAKDAYYDAKADLKRGSAASRRDETWSESLKAKADEVTQGIKDRNPDSVTGRVADVAGTAASALGAVASKATEMASSAVHKVSGAVSDVAETMGLKNPSVDKDDKTARRY